MEVRIQGAMACFAAFLLTILLIRWSGPFAWRFGLLDIPNHRKKHSHPVPIVGGIAMMISFIAFLPFLAAPLANLTYLVMALVLICITGVFDDLHDLAANEKFLLQALAALAMTVLGGICVEHLGNLFGLGPISTGPLKAIFTIICVLGVVNAINMMDGVDGLAGALALVACCWYALLAWLSGTVVIQGLALLLAGAISGFLAFNLRTPWRSRASVFMGDAGSMSLGLLLTWFAVELSGHHSSKVTPITSVWVLALPLIDMACVMLRRIRKRVSPFSADHEHLHYVLQHAGYSVSETVLIKVIISALLGGIGFAGWALQVPEYVMFYTFMLLLGLYYYAMSHAWLLSKLLRRPPHVDGQRPSPTETVSQISLE
jgi:UDP-GlcNAc:undecaprenyl-phosphate/decaprenyl-phosphate GlcNAc-1-phosphate transferase